MQSKARALASLLWLAGTAAGCEGVEPCREDPGAQTLEQRVDVEIGDDTLLAELANDETARDRGWKKRACDREALLLVPDQPGPLPVWGCELVDPIDVIGIRGEQVVFVERLDPCVAPCGGCPTVGDGVPVDAVLEVLADALEARVGSPASIP